MKKFNVIFFLVVMGYYSCAQIYVTTYVNTGKNGKESHSQKTIILSDAYFDIELGINGNHEFRASKVISPITDPNNYKYVTMDVTDKLGKPMFFKTNSDFLNHMHKNGYDMVSQQKQKYGYAYTFKKR